MQRHESDQQAGNKKDVQCEEARQRCARDDGPAQQHVHSLRANQRHAAGDRRPDAEPPVGVLVEAQHLPGKRHAQGHKQQEHTDDPGELAGKFVSAE